jgi:hypothetical protein
MTKTLLFTVVFYKLAFLTYQIKNLIYFQLMNLLLPPYFCENQRIQPIQNPLSFLLGGLIGICIS